MNEYKKKGHLLFKRNGTCQAERIPPQLVDNGLLIDEKALDEHVVFVYLYTDLIKYYEHEDTAADSNVWRKFLESDDTVILSLILQTEIDSLRSLINDDLLALTKRKDISSDNKYMKRLLRIVQELILLIDYWRRNLSSTNKVRLELQTLVTHELNNHITLLYGLLKQWDSYSTSAAFTKFCEFIDKICDEGPPWELVPQLLNENFVSDTLPDNTVSALRDSLDTILSSLHNLQVLAQERYPFTLSSQEHKPQMALLIAFLRLLQYVSQCINEIPRRHLDFYYKEVLKFRHRPIQADQTVVCFQLQDGLNHYNLPQGTQLSAGKDAEGHDIRFATNTALLVNRATLGQVHQIHQSIQVNDEEGALPTGRIMAATYDAKELSNPQPDTHAYKGTIQHTFEEPLLGLVIASPLLYLKEGYRDINLKFEFSSKSFDSFLNKIKRHKDEGWRSMQERLTLLFKEAIEVQLTSKEQWFKLPLTAITTAITTEEENCLGLRLSLSPDIPPIIGLDPEVEEESYNLQVPALRLGLKDAAHFGHIYLLKDLVLDKVTLEVAVRDYRGLVLQNDLGLVDSSLPFQPFGPLPQLHSNFYVGSDEIFSKELKSLKINIVWEDLPEADEGWQDYYQGYPQKIVNEDFRVSISYLNHRQWHPFYTEQRQEVPLFSTRGEGVYAKQLQSKHVIDEIDLDRLNLTETNPELAEPSLTPNTLAGFLRLELASPSMAFGHDIYPELMSSAFVQSTKNKDQASLVAPQEPYTPLIKSLSVDYTAKEEMVLKSTPGEQPERHSQAIMRLSPFGYKQIFPQKSDSVAFLLDPENVGCFLFWGFEQLSTSLLALHIQIDEDSIDPDKEFPKPTWQYLSRNEWISLKNEEIISDGTDGLAKSGILVLSIPEDVNTDNTLLNSGLVWVRARFPEGLEALPKLVSIHTQAVTASRIIEEEQTDEPSLSLPPGTIQSIVGSPPAINEVLQPFPSFGGRPTESTEQLYTKVSERLRHKHRAVSAWDYERLILEKFPEIFRAKCVNHSSRAHPTVPYPGRVVIVVINKLKSVNEKDTFTPKVSKQLLREIERYLKSVASPFIEFEVMSHMYEEIQVNAEVKFRPFYEKGIYLNRLQEAISNFLSPWLFDQTEDIKLGGVIPSSKIIDFINKKEYVEGIGNFSILKYTGKGDELKITKITNYDNYLRASYPWSVMVSADTHQIDVVDELQTNAGLRQGGVADMRIGGDFVIGPWREAILEPQQAAPKALIKESLEEYYLVTKKNIKNIVNGDS